jgi:hypothetical protein
MEWEKTKMKDMKDIAIFIAGGWLATRLFSGVKANPSSYGVTSGCDPATSDPKLNRRNKEKAVKLAHYGANPFGKGVGLAKVVDEVYIAKVRRVLPLMVSVGHNNYWKAKARRERIGVRRAREEICGNCKAFDVSPEQVRCGGAGGKMVAVMCTISGHPRPTRTLGFCQAWNFTCSAFRTCDSWVGGDFMQRD